MSVQVENTSATPLYIVPLQANNLAGAYTPASVGAVRLLAENDAGVRTNEAYLASPEVDDDYRKRVSHDALLAQEFFLNTAQNTGRWTYSNTTMTIAWASGVMQTNATGITTITTGVRFSTYAVFPITNAQATYCEVVACFTNTLTTTNTTIDFGLCTLNAANPYAPTDGVYFRMDSSGLSGVVNFNGSPVSVALSSFTSASPSGAAATFAANTYFKFTIVIGLVDVEFWINDELYGTISRPAGVSGPCLFAAQPFSVRHAIAGGAAGAVQSLKVASYNVSIGGYLNGPSRERGNAWNGELAYEGRTGGTMGSTSAITNSQAITAATLSNTAAIITGLGGRCGITIGASANTDGIVWSYQNPANSSSFPGRPLIIRGVWIDSVVQTALGATAVVLNFYLAYGHTAVSLATAEAATTKAPRRVALGGAGFVASAAAGVQAPRIYCKFDEPIVVQPGEFVALVAQQPLGATGTIHVTSGVDAGLA